MTPKARTTTSEFEGAMREGKTACWTSHGVIFYSPGLRVPAYVIPTRHAPEDPLTPLPSRLPVRCPPPTPMQTTVPRVSPIPGSLCSYIPLVTRYCSMNPSHLLGMRCRHPRNISCQLSPFAPVPFIFTDRPYFLGSRHCLSPTDLLRSPSRKPRIQHLHFIQPFI